METSTYRIQGATGEWEVVIGLEVHAQITTHAKLFSGASTVFGAEPNAQVSLVDAAMPGMLPVPNRECIRQAVRTGMALNAQINPYSRFDRKNYFYADLPQGYQISQLYHPLVGEGSLMIEEDEKAGIAEPKRIGIERIHVEQDAGKIGYDCSGFTRYAYAGVGVLLPKYSGDQYNAGRHIPPSQAKRGDLIFYGPEGTQHVTIYLGNGQMLEESSAAGQVTVSPVRTAGMTPYLTRIIET